MQGDGTRMEAEGSRNKVEREKEMRVKINLDGSLFPGIDSSPKPRVLFAFGSGSPRTNPYNIHPWFIFLFVSGEIQPKQSGLLWAAEGGPAGNKGERLFFSNKVVRLEGRLSVVKTRRVRQRLLYECGGKK